MSKFKVGDRVSCDGWSNFGGNGYLIVAVESDYYKIGKSNDESAISSIDYYFEDWDNRLRLFKPKSPVVEKTVKSIEAGVYDCVTIQQSSTGEWRYSVEPYMTADQLESAAQTFMELAAYLKEKE